MNFKTKTITFYVISLFLFCYFLRLFNIPNELTLILGSLLCVIMLVQQKKFRIDVGICLLTISLMSYYVIVNGVEGLAFSILYIPLLMYEIGNYLLASEEKTDNREKRILWLLFLMILGYGLHGILNSYMWYAGYVVPGTRRWMDFWNHEIVPGTQHIAYFLPIMSAFLPGMLCFKERKVLNIILGIVTLFFVYTSLATRSRMSIVIFAIICMVQIILYAIYERENLKTVIKSKWFWVLITMSGLGAVVGFVLIKDSDVVVAFIDNMSKGGGILNNVRFKAQKMALQQLFVYPMGGNLMDLGGISHSHNTWLDMANAAGLIPFLSFAAYTGYSLYQLIKLLAKKCVMTQTKLLLVGIYGAFFLYMSVEPVLEASIHLMTPWLFVNGMVCGHNSSK